MELWDRVGERLRMEKWVRGGDNSYRLVFEPELI